MKRKNTTRLAALLLGALLLLAGCTVAPQAAPTATPAPTPAETAQPPAEPTATPAPPPTPAPTEEPGDELDALRHAVHEFGEPDSLVEYDGDFAAMILYPQTHIDSVNEELQGWAQALLAEAKSNFASIKAEELGKDAEMEVTVNYDAFLVKNQFAGILEEGYYGISTLAHPADVVKTLNVDLIAQKILTADEIFPEEGRGAVLALISEELAKIDENIAQDVVTIDESFLEPFVLRGEGVSFVYERGDKLPAALGTQHVTLSYEALGDALALPQYAADRKPDMPEPTPEFSIQYVPVQGEQAPGDAPDATPDADPQPTADPDRKPAQTDAPVKEYSVDPGKPMIALTFDDGPAASTTKILKLLDAYGGRATFCMIGNRVNAKADTVRAVVAQGSEIACHTWDHKKLTNLSAADVREQLKKTGDTVYEIAGVRPRFLRPPYGSVNDTVKRVAGELGMPIANWSIDTEDWKTRNAQKTYDAIMKDVKDGSIILCHDLHKETGDAMEKVIPELARRGYQMVTLSELLASAQPGSVYRHK